MTKHKLFFVFFVHHLCPSVPVFLEHKGHKVPIAIGTQRSQSMS